MQSIFRLPWSSDQFGLGAADKVRFGASMPPSRPDVPIIKPVAKRKRASTPDPESTPRSEAKRLRPATSSNADQVSSFTATVKPEQQPVAVPLLPSATPALPTPRPSNASEIEQRSESMDDITMSDSKVEVEADRRMRLCQAIENQFNVQILMKHREMRLIDQELAKCQVALEQLRRCELRPYPGTTGFDYALSTGTGAAVQAAPGYTNPSHAPPYAVVDGPYTRHYRRWLVSDPMFDTQPVNAMNFAQSAATARGGRVGRKAVPTPMYGLQTRHEFAGMPQAVAPAPKKENNMPLVLRRSTDNKLVRLVCNNCNRGNMSSIQGFLNHCRIAHKVVYESHDAAAKDCGRILDEQELASLPAETQTAPLTKPAARHAPPRAQSVILPASSASVHPLNMPGGKVKASKPSSKARAVSTPVIAQGPLQAAAAFKPSDKLPHLSALFVRKQAGGDLEQAAVEARSRPDFGFEELVSPASITPGSPAIAASLSGKSGLSAHRVHGGKGRSQMAQPSYFGQQADSPRDLNHSPHGVDSNPGMVSDLEDDDNGSASESESNAIHHSIGHSLGATRTCGDGAMDLAVAGEDAVVHHDGLIIRRNSTFSTDGRAPPAKLGGGQV